ncbi:MAG TPA: TonB-dependent receptor [Xanthobacteraceae bacterium]|nr:TonB-dependent receptor [Xanthobacteraceae bacterium]
MKRVFIAALLCAVAAGARAQTVLPTITIEAPRTQNDQAPRGQQPAAAPLQLPQSLTVPNVLEAIQQIQRTPGAVNVVPREQFGNKLSVTPKDILDYVPGVFVQPKWGEDSKLSIRGSGLSRNFHLRSTQLYMDGIPINTADGYGDFQELDPSAYRYVEVYKGANALRFGANSLGGAINFVTPTGYDAKRLSASVDFGSFGFQRFQSSSGGVFGPADYFITGSFQEQDGFRDHSYGDSIRASANFGYKLSPVFETRFYINSNTIRQRIPGEVDRNTALTSPRTANADNVNRDFQRNIDSLRIANKSTLRLENTTIEFGVFGVDRHLKHPIPVWLDYAYQDYGGFVRAVNESQIAGFRNRLITGLNIHNGEVDAQTFVNLANAVKGPLIGRTRDKSQNYSAYFENAFYFLPDVALITGTQYLLAIRDRVTLNGAAVPGRTNHDLWSPKAGLLWDVDRNWQVFANVSRSAEAPSFGEGSALFGPFTAIRPQKATTVELGTRGNRETYAWDLAVYRGNYRDELQCLNSGGGICELTNAQRTMHQGIEAGFGFALFSGLAAPGKKPDRLWLNTAYTFSDFRFDNDPLWGNNLLPGAPRHYVRSELMYRHPAGFSFGPNIEWVPQAYFVDNANTMLTASYALLGFRAVYEANNNFTFYLDARNLTDEAYISSVSIANVFGVGPTNLFNPGNARAIYGGVRITY